MEHGGTDMRREIGQTTGYQVLQSNISSSSPSLPPFLVNYAEYLAVLGTTLQ